MAKTLAAVACLLATLVLLPAPAHAGPGVVAAAGNVPYDMPPDSFCAIGPCCPGEVGIRGGPVNDYRVAVAVDLGTGEGTVMVQQGLVAGEIIVFPCAPRVKAYPPGSCTGDLLEDVQCTETVTECTTTKQGKGKKAEATTTCTTRQVVTMRLTASGMFTGQGVSGQLVRVG